MSNSGASNEEVMMSKSYEMNKIKNEALQTLKRMRTRLDMHLQVREYYQLYLKVLRIAAEEGEEKDTSSGMMLGVKVMKEPLRWPGGRDINSVRDLPICRIP